MMGAVAHSVSIMLLITKCSACLHFKQKAVMYANAALYASLDLFITFIQASNIHLNSSCKQVCMLQLTTQLRSSEFKMLQMSARQQTEVMARSDSIIQPNNNSIECCLQYRWMMVLEREVSLELFHMTLCQEKCQEQALEKCELQKRCMSERCAALSFCNQHLHVTKHS